MWLFYKIFIIKLLLMIFFFGGQKISGGKEKWKTFPEFTIYPLTRDGNSYPSIWCRGFRP
ncbi:hypothetical protein C5O09_12695 [Akkermansia muciniphila]|nr:hypothetical protein C5O09_12695 [Akkermansia muciniphila]